MSSHRYQLWHNVHDATPIHANVFCSEVVEDALDAQQDQIAAESKTKKKAAIMKNINKSKSAKVTSKKEKK